MKTLDRSAVEALVTRAHREVDQGLLPSCQVALAFDGELVAFEAIGEATPETRYLAWSCTKGVMAGAMWMLVAEGLDVATPVSELVPEFGANGKGHVTVEHLLLHTGGFPFAPLGPPDWYDREARLRRFASWRLRWPPGSRFVYHPFAAHWVLAEIIERWCAASWREVVRDRIALPLGLTGLSIGVPVEDQAGVADIVRVGEAPPEVAGPVPSDDDVALFNHPEVRALGIPGAGAITTAADLALYYQALIHHPEPLWEPALVAEAATIRNTMPDPLLGLPANRGWGVMVAGADGSAWAHGFGRTTSPRAFGHDGAGGQLAWADPETGVSMCYLTNGMDRDVRREWRRNIAIASLAGACACAP